MHQDQHAQIGPESCRLRLSPILLSLSSLSVLALSGCQLFRTGITSSSSEFDPAELTRPQVRLKPEVKQTLRIEMARYQAILIDPQMSDGQAIKAVSGREEQERSGASLISEQRAVRVEAKLTLGSVQGVWTLGSTRRFTLSAPRVFSDLIKVAGDCQIERPSRGDRVVDESSRGLKDERREGEGREGEGREGEGREGEQLSSISVTLTLQCRASEPGQGTLKLSYQAPWEALTGHALITEGARRYHLVYLPRSLAGEVFVGFSEAGEASRVVELSAPAELHLSGHPISELASFSWTRAERERPEAQPQGVARQAADQTGDRAPKVDRLLWDNGSSRQAFPMFFSFGDWDQARALKLKVPLSGDGAGEGEVIQSGDRVATRELEAQLVTPLGSGAHRVRGKSLTQIQVEAITQHAQQLSFTSLALRDQGRADERRGQRSRPLLFLTLPDHSNYQPPNLSHYGLIFIDESWFYLNMSAEHALPALERLKLYERLYLALGDHPSVSARDEREDGVDLLRALARWSASQHLSLGDASSSAEARPKPASAADASPAAEAARPPQARSLYLIERARDLRELAGSAQRPMSSQMERRGAHPDLLTHVLQMSNAWLSARAASGGELRVTDWLSRVMREVRPVSDPSDTLREVGRQLSRVDPHLKSIFESFLSNPGLPLVHVKWTQVEAPDHIKVRFTISQRPFLPHQRDYQLKPEMWIIPICLRLGVKDNPTRVHCLLLDQSERSDYEIKLDAPLEWVHPNAGQEGVYVWSLEDADFERLLDTDGLSLVEQLSLVEMSSNLLEVSLGDPKLYLRAVEEIVYKCAHPLALTQLFTHLNQIVLYFGQPDDDVGIVERWASGILQGVMISQDRFSLPPLNHFTQLQLAQWDRGEASQSALTARDLKLIEEFLKPVTSRDSFEDEGEKVDLEALQYPLLIKALSGDLALWEKLLRKFAESENQPLKRLIVIRALVQFMDPELFRRTLSMLSVTPVDDDQVAHTETTEPMTGSDSSAEGGAVDDPSQDTLRQGQAHDHDEPDSARAEGLTMRALSSEDALELVRLVRSLRAKQLAWDWFMAQRRPIEEAIYQGEQLELQEGVLRWASAICDERRLQELEAVFKGDRGFQRLALDRAKMSLSSAQRCVSVRRSRGVIERVIQARLSAK